ncbi:MAG: hypothetical protein AB7H80_04460, partial [Candidatus Kapaibacterium sp.]
MGHYTGDDWISLSDIDKYGVEYETYLLYEDAYLICLRQLMNCSSISTLYISDIEYKVDLPPHPNEDKCTINFQKAYRLNGSVKGELLDTLVRMCLREKLWCKLVGDSDFYVHFGYDYYMFVGGSAIECVDITWPKLMFVEEMDSPYQGSDE